MKRAVFWGDSHGNGAALEMHLAEMLDAGIHPDVPSFHVGDVGFGFAQANKVWPISLPVNARFIPGNHDCSAVYVGHPACLGRFGYLPEWKMLFVGGAQSTDQDRRIPGESWWEDEELTDNELDELYGLIDNPIDIVVSHDFPQEVVSIIANKPIMERSRTRLALQMIFANLATPIWVGGHWHRNVSFRHQGTQFYCVGENQWQEIVW